MENCASSTVGELSSIFLFFQHIEMYITSMAFLPDMPEKLPLKKAISCHHILTKSTTNG